MPANRFSVHHKPTKTPSIGNWAVVNNNTGRIVARSKTQSGARAHARIRGGARH
jgi:hypothetical protein